MLHQSGEDITPASYLSAQMATSSGRISGTTRLVLLDFFPAFVANFQYGITAHRSLKELKDICIGIQL